MTSVWWPGISHKVENMVTQCLTCTRDLVLQKEPMIPAELPEYPWQKIGIDKNATYLLVDYFSRYPEIQKLSTTTSHSTESDVRMIRNSRDNGQ